MELSAVVSPLLTKSSRLAVLITCHNRKETTSLCFQALAQSEDVPGLLKTVYLLDDGSDDGTAEAVVSEFPETVILRGDGTLYWGGGMRRIWARALQDGNDHYLWLNDDTFVHKGALRALFETEEEVLNALGVEPITFGSCRNPETLRRTYGGYRRRHRRFPLSLDAVAPEDHWIRCDTMEGNLVLVPHAVVQKIGMLDEEFVHAGGDNDYGFRATAAGIPVVAAPGYLADCIGDTEPRPWMDGRLSFRERLSHMLSPKGLPPRQWLLYVRRHGGWLWPYYYSKPWIRVAFPRLARLLASGLTREPSTPAHAPSER